MVPYLFRKIYIYRFNYDRTKRFTKLLDECTVDTTGVYVEIIHDFERVADKVLGLSEAYNKSKSKSKSSMLTSQSLSYQSLRSLVRNMKIFVKRFLIN